MLTTVPTLLDGTMLPCPQPLPEAIDAGVFGVCGDGTLGPSPDEVAAITAEHACGMLDLLCQVKHLERCLRYDIHPTSGKPMHGPDREERRSAVIRRTKALTLDYDARREAYAAAFGWNSATALDELLQDLVRESASPSVPAHQQQLF
jgi:hypothetical protein